MPNFSPYSNFGYCALLKEASAGTPAGVPSVYLRILSESLQANFLNQEINEVAGDRERRRRSIDGQVEVNGDIEFLVEPRLIGHFLRSVYGAPTTQTIVAATSYRHTFGVSDSIYSYTFDVQVADAPWVHRFFGAYINKLDFSRLENAWKVTASVTAMKAFVNSRVTTAANSGTTLLIDQTSGLHADDTILVIKGAGNTYAAGGGYTTVQSLTITSVDSETQLTVETITQSISVDDIVVIKRATVSDSDYTMLDPFTFQGGTALYVGANIDNVTEEAKEDITITILNELEARYNCGLDQKDRFASAILLKGFLSEANITKYFDHQSYIDRARANAEMGLRIFLQNESAISANSSVKARTYWGTGNGFYVEASTAGRAGNDINVTIVVASNDTLAASISGNNVLISLANTTASKNTGTLIAAAVNALTGVDSVAEGAGTQQFTTAVANQNLGDTVTGSTAAVVGVEASEKSYLQFDFAAGIIDSHPVNNKENAVVTEEIPIKFYKDIDATDSQRKGWSNRVRLLNSIASY